MRRPRSRGPRRGRRPSGCGSPSTNAFARLAGIVPTVWVSPNCAGSSAPGITNVRVTLLLIASAAKSALSHEVDASLSMAWRGSVPTQGRGTPSIGGQVDLGRACPGPGPRAPARLASSLGRVAQAPPSGCAQTPSTASASSRADPRRSAGCRGRGAGQGGRGDQAGPGDAGDVGPVGLAPLLELEEHRLVADAVDALGGHQLRARLHAAGEPVEHGVVGPLAPTRGARELGGLDGRDLRALAWWAMLSNSRTSAATPRGSANRVSWQGRTRPLPSVLSPVAVSVQRRPRTWSDTWEALSRTSSENSSGGSGRSRGLADGVVEGSVDGVVAGERRPDAGRIGDQGAADEDGGDGDADADQGVGTPARGARAAQDRRPRPRDVVGLLAQRVEQRPDVGGRDVTVHGELRGGGLQDALGLGPGQADLAGHVGHADAGELGQQQRLALGDRQLAERLERGARLLVEAPVAVPDPRGVPALRVRPGVRPGPALGVGQAGDLGPEVPGDDERVADGAARGREVAGECVGLQQQSRPRLLVEGIEVVGSVHGQSTVGEYPSQMHTGVGALFATFLGARMAGHDFVARPPGPRRHPTTRPIPGTDDRSWCCRRSVESRPRRRP